MPKHPILLLISLSLLFFHPHPGNTAQVILNSDDQFRYAQELMKKEQYSLAVVEWERFIHFFPEDENVPRARLLMGVCHLNAGAHEQARNTWDSVYKLYPDRLVGGKALFLIGESYYRQGVYDEANYYFRRVRETYPHPELRDAALYRLGWSQMQLRQWHEASDTFKEIDTLSPFHTSAQEMTIKSLEGEALLYKDPASAGVMAAALPGLGHVYCGRYKDGVVAFLLNGLFIWAAIEAFDHDQDVLGGILTFLELGWYSGSIYSAVNSAHKHNKKLKDDYLQNLPDSLDLKIFSTAEGLVGSQPRPQIVSVG